jgi:hypothetical protein
MDHVAIVLSWCTYAGPTHTLDRCRTASTNRALGIVPSRIAYQEAMTDSGNKLQVLRGSRWSEVH